MSTNHSRYSCISDFPENAAIELELVARAIVLCNPEDISGDIREALGMEIDEDNPETSLEAWITEHDAENMAAQLRVSHQGGKLWISGHDPNMDVVSAVISAVMEKHGVEEPLVIPVAVSGDADKPNQPCGEVWAIGAHSIMSETLRETGRKLSAKIREKQDKDAPKPSAPRP